MSSRADLRYETELSRFSSAHHRVALAGARLPVGEHAHVVSLERVMQHLNTNVLVDTTLTRKRPVTRLTSQTTLMIKI